MTAFAIKIPDWHPARLNQIRGRHWSREHAAKREAADWIGAYGTMQERPLAQGRRRVYLVLIAPWRGSRRPDRDAYDKVLLDALVQSGYLLDDSSRGLEGRMRVVFHRGPKRTVIVLEDVASG